MRRRTVKNLLAICSLAIAISIAGCGSQSGRPTSPTSTAAANDNVVNGGTPFHIAHPAKFGMIQGLVVFPPRNEPNTFFQDLQVLYRDVLQRSQVTTYVDPEGLNVWLTEYFRFYLNGCSHQEATSRAIQEISTGVTLPTCGAETTAFPPRNLPNEFQTQLEATYRDVLGRSQVLSYVDGEGANVWLAQYLRLRLSGCAHAEAETKVFTEIQGGGVQADCALSGDSAELISVSPPFGSTLRPSYQSNSITATIRYSLASAANAYLCALAAIAQGDGSVWSTCLPVEIRRGSGIANVTFAVSPMSVLASPLTTRVVRVMMGRTQVFVNPLVDKFSGGTFIWTPFAMTTSPSATISLNPLLMRVRRTAPLEIRSIGQGPLTVQGIRYSTEWCNGNWSGVIPSGGVQIVTVSCIDPPGISGWYHGNLTVDADHSSGRNTIDICVGTTTLPGSGCS